MSTSYSPAIGVNNSSKYAIISASSNRPTSGGTATSTFGNITYGGFPNTTLTADATLTCYATFIAPDPADNLGTFGATFTANLGGTSTVFGTTHTPTQDITKFTFTVPSGTNLANLTVTIHVSAAAPVDGGAITASRYLYDIAVF